MGWHGTRSGEGTRIVIDRWITFSSSQHTFETASTLHNFTTLHTFFQSRPDVFSFCVSKSFLFQQALEVRVTIIQATDLFTCSATTVANSQKNAQASTTITTSISIFLWNIVCTINDMMSFSGPIPLDHLWAIAVDRCQLFRQCYGHLLILI